MLGFVYLILSSVGLKVKYWFGSVSMGRCWPLLLPSLLCGQVLCSFRPVDLRRLLNHAWLQHCALCWTLVFLLPNLLGQETNAMHPLKWGTPKSLRSTSFIHIQPVSPEAKTASTWSKQDSTIVYYLNLSLNTWHIPAFSGDTLVHVLKHGMTKLF